MKPQALRLLAGVLIEVSVSDVFAQPAYPSRAIRMLVPFPAGAGVDIVARMLAVPLAQTLGQPVVVDNRPGAGGTLACELAAKAPPDGYTLLLGNISTFAMAPAIYKQLSYEPVKSFAPMAFRRSVFGELLRSASRTRVTS